MGSTLQQGRYTIRGCLGKGGFGITYLATDQMLERTVAVKEFFLVGSTRHTQKVTPPTTFGANPFGEAKQRFMDEAKALASLQHPGIVRVLDVFEDNQTAYMVMDYVEGSSLAARLEQGPLRPAAAIKLAQSMAEALQVVHHAGLLHRDIKPDNILLEGGVRPVLVDFGSARAFSQDQTVQHTRMVTAGYAAPEQYASAARFGPYTDVYGLSATLYHCVVGHAPPPATDRLMGTSLPPLPADLPPQLSNAILNGLALRIDERPPTVQHFLALLSGGDPPPHAGVPTTQPPEVATTQPINPANVSPAAASPSDAANSSPSAPKGRKRGRSKWGYVTAVVLVLGLAGAYAALPYWLTPQQAATDCIQKLLSETPLAGCVKPDPGNAAASLSRLLRSEWENWNLSELENLKLEVLSTDREWRNATVQIQIGEERLLPTKLSFGLVGWHMDLNTLATEVLNHYKSAANDDQANLRVVLVQLRVLDTAGMENTDKQLVQLSEEISTVVKRVSQLDPEFSTPVKVEQIQNIRTTLQTAVQTAKDRAKAESLANEADQLYEQGNYSQAVDRIQKARALYNKLGDSDTQLGYLAYLEAFVLRDYDDAPNNKQRAIAAARLSTELDPSKAEYWCSYGDMLRQQKFYSQSRSAFERGLNESDNNEERSHCQTWYGVLNFMQDDYWTARSRWQQALSLDPTNADAQRMLNTF